MRGEVTGLDTLPEHFGPTGTGRLLPRWFGRQGIIALVILGPVLAVVTVLALDAKQASGSGNAIFLRAIILTDLVYTIVLLALIGVQIGALVIARRRGSAGSKLHLRLTGVFATIALVPTIIVAVFATISVNYGVETWFSEKVGSVVRNSLATAEAYEREHRAKIKGDILAMANDLNRAASQGITQTQLNELVTRQAILRELPEAYVFSSDREIVARGEFSYLFNFEAPTEDQLARARTGEVIVITDEANNEIRALVYLSNFFDDFLYVTRNIEGEVLGLLDETRETVALYETLNRDRDKILFDFALIYLGFALLIIMSSILLGLWFAERLSRPVGRLAGAAQSIGEGNLDVRIKEERGSDEIAMLSRTFNRMAAQLKHQRDDLVQSNRESEERRNFIETVLSGVTAGVIGLDGQGRVDLLNRAAGRLLNLDTDEAENRYIGDLVPEFGSMLEDARRASNLVARGDIRQMVGGETREFLARIAPRRPGSAKDGFVLSFDDITALASAQRMAAWGDVARRIAHEIKNPLTPIQLSADRLRRKYVTRLGEEGESFEQYLDVITRQAGDIRRMVDEFSRFARMPQPIAVREDLAELLQQAILLQEQSRPDIAYELDMPEGPIPIVCDRGLLNQCLTNLLQNAADAIDARRERDGDATPAARIRITVTIDDGTISVIITDNGIGFPKSGRERLTDPYVTTRVKGTGLGLAIVKKIIEQHGGDLVLGDSAGANDLDGAQVVIRLPSADRQYSDTDTGETTERPEELGGVG